MRHRGSPGPRRGLSAALASILLAAISCGPAADRAPAETALGDDAITVASFDFSESVIVAEIYARALESAGFEVERALEIGPRELVQPALERGLVELVPEYLGTALSFLRGGLAEPPSGPEAAHGALEAELGRRGLAALDPAPAQDANGFAVTAETASELGLTRISDLAAFDDDLVFGGPSECPERPLCLEGLTQTYGLGFERFVALDASGPVTAAALASGEVDVALLFTTSGYLAGGRFVLLDDDRGLQPPENVVPVVRDEVLARHGNALRDVVDRVSAALTTEDLAELNRAVDLQGRSPALVAAMWLRSLGLEG